MKEIKLVIDGKEVALLTAEQIKAMGIDVDDGCVCDRVKQEEFYWYIDTYGLTEKACDLGCDSSDLIRFLAGNYYRDESYAKQIAMHQHLTNLLRRYSEQHGGDAEWDGENLHYRIVKDMVSNIFRVEAMCFDKCDVVYFCSKEVAEDAIEEVVKPFMEEYPDFVW